CETLVRVEFFRLLRLPRRRETLPRNANRIEKEAAEGSFLRIRWNLPQSATRFASTRPALRYESSKSVPRALDKLAGAPLCALPCLLRTHAGEVGKQVLYRRGANQNKTLGSCGFFAKSPREAITPCVTPSEARSARFFTEMRKPGAPDRRNA